MQVLRQDKLTTRPYVALGVLCFGLVIVVLDNSILNLALPALARDLDASTSDLQWTVDSYTLVYACLMLTAGSLGDRFGRRRSMFWGVAMFGVTSALAAFATSADTLIIYRALMGACAAFITPASLSIITNLFHDPQERARAIGIWASVSAIGIVAGPVVGGILLEHFWWGSVFLVNVPIAAVLVTALPRFVPETKDPSPTPIDPVGALLSIVAMSALIWATIAGPDHGWGSSTIVGAYAIGVAATIGFIAWENNRTDPMIDLGFFRLPAFSAATGANICMVAAWSATMFGFVQLLQSVLGYSPLEAGLRLAPFAVVGAFGAIVATPLSNRIGRRQTISLGLLGQLIGSLLMLSYDYGDGYAMASVYMFVYSSGQALVFSQCVASVMDSVPREKSGVASGANNTCRQSALAFGVAIGGSILASRFRSELAVRTESIGLERDTIEKAGRSIAGAVQVAEELPRDTGSALLEVAHQAFIPAFHAVMVTSAAFCAVGIAITLIWLPTTRPRTEEP